MYFKDRAYAGKKLARLLKRFESMDVVVYALPRGGVVVGAEIAKALHAPLDLIITRKIGHPNQSELAIAAVSENGQLVIDPQYQKLTRGSWFFKALEKEKAEAQRRREIYLKNKNPVSCKGKTAIIADDGIATGLTLRSAVKQLKSQYRPVSIIAAAPVIPEDIAQELEKEGIVIAAVERTNRFRGSIGAYYKDFSQASDEEVIKLVSRSVKKQRLTLRNMQGI